jgi:DNA processing protein
MSRRDKRAATLRVLPAGMAAPETPQGPYAPFVRPLVGPPAPPASAVGAGTGDVLPCGACLRRAWLVARLSGHIEWAWLARRPLPAVLALPDAELIAGLAGGQRARIEREYEAFEPHHARAACAAARVVAVCRCDARYPGALRELPDAPAVLHVHRDAERFLRCVAGDAVAIVGARRASPYGLEQARGLGRGLAAAGVTVVSGMALGIDAAAHAGALAGGGLTLAVLAGGPERAYPASKRRLHEQIAATGAVVSELPPGAQARRWGFPARNRIIAALARVTVVVEASERSGSLITAGLAADLGRDIAAVPGLVTSPLSEGAHGLIADGARLVRGAHDVLELLFGAGAPQLALALGRTGAGAHAPAGGRLSAGAHAPAGGRLSAGAHSPADALAPDLQALLGEIGGGRDTIAALTDSGHGLDAVLAGLAQLELRGRVRRTAGGRFVVVAQVVR